MPEPMSIYVDGQEHHVEPGTTVAAALLNIGFEWPPSYVGGGLGGPVCGMGICYECCVSIDGVWGPSCVRPCENGMRIETRRA